MLLFFVNDRISKWNASAREKFSRTHQSAMETVMEAAKKFSVSVTIDTIIEEVTVPLSCKREDANVWIGYIMSKYSSKLFLGYKKHYRQTLGYDQLAVAFVFNRDFRAYAFMNGRSSNLRTECSVLDAYASERTIIHELFHQFGAQDLYYPEELVKIVRKRNYRSIMGYGNGIHIDPLTAYAIGWSEEIDAETVGLLEDTKHISLREIIEGKKRS